MLLLLLLLLLLRIITNTISSCFLVFSSLFLVWHYYYHHYCIAKHNWAKKFIAITHKGRKIGEKNGFFPLIVAAEWIIPAVSLLLWIKQKCALFSQINLHSCMFPFCIQLKVHLNLHYLYSDHAINIHSSFWSSRVVFFFTVHCRGCCVDYIDLFFSVLLLLTLQFY